jgi:hypothetical protein
MDEVIVRRADIDALTEAVEGSGLPSPDLLRALVTAIGTALGEDEVVSVSVEVDSVAEQFETAFAAEPSPSPPSPGGSVRVTVMKIGR